MNEEVKKLWAEALRSGKYPAYTEILIENAGALHCGDGFCIFGVLCELHREKNGGEWVPNKINKHLAYLNDTAFPPLPVIKWLGVEPKKPSLAHYIAANHDENKAIDLANPEVAVLVEWMSLGNRKSFAEMANIIEGKKEDVCVSSTEPQSISTVGLGNGSPPNPDPSKPADSSPPSTSTAAESPQAVDGTSQPVPSEKA